MNTKSYELTAKRFGKWTVIRKSKARQNGSVLWLCKCDCGKESFVTASCLVGGKSQACVTCSHFALRLKECKFGHKLEEWGRTESGGCRGCIKSKSLFREYGITLKEYEDLWKYQNGKCAICGKDIALFPKGTPGWHEQLRTETDHDHDKKYKDNKKASVRGLLCGGQWNGCNRLIGGIDDINWLRSVVKYLENPPAQALFRAKEQ